MPSTFQSLESKGNAARQNAILAGVQKERTRCLQDLKKNPPGLWFTYHSYYKAPDLLGPFVSQALGIPYVVCEGSYAAKRDCGPWQRFARHARDGLKRAALHVVLKPRDEPALRTLCGPTIRFLHLPPFIEDRPDPGEEKRISGQLLTVAMMRPGDKLASYEALLESLSGVRTSGWQWIAVGDGPARELIETRARKQFGSAVSFPGALDPAALNRLYRQSDLYLWPGINEAIGMTYLEAQAAGLPVIAFNLPGQRTVTVQGETACLVPPGSRQSFAEAIDRLLNDRSLTAHMRGAALLHVKQRHTMEQAAHTLKSALIGLPAPVREP